MIYYSHFVWLHIENTHMLAHLNKYDYAKFYINICTYKLNLLSMSVSLWMSTLSYPFLFDWTRIQTNSLRLEYGRLSLSIAVILLPFSVINHKLLPHLCCNHRVNMFTPMHHICAIMVAIFVQYYSYLPCRPTRRPHVLLEIRDFEREIIKKICSRF
jgi:hypothetical protein